MKRGDVVIVSERGQLTGKPRPAVVVQSDTATPLASRVTVALITSSDLDLPLVRVLVHPDERNGLAKSSRIMADRLMTVRKTSIDRVIGSLDDRSMQSVDVAMRRWLSL